MYSLFDIRKAITLCVALLILSLYLFGCKSMDRSQKGAVIGMGAGGAVGAGIGKASGNTALGTILGAAIGGAAGGFIGKRMDEQASKISTIPGAQVKRVAEGINVTFDSGVLFPSNQASLSDSSMNTLGKLAEILRQYPDTYILVEGHTDSSGPNQYNARSSRKRAERVARFIASRDVDRTRIRTAWFGEDQPRYPNSDAAGMAKNRRVEFAIYATEKWAEEARNNAGSDEN